MGVEALFKNNMDSCLEVSDNSFLDTPDSWVYTTGPRGQFVNREFEAFDILHKTNNKWISEVILKRLSKNLTPYVVLLY